MFIDKSLSEKELLYDLVTSEKEISSLYHHGIIDAFNPQLRDIMASCFSNTQEIQASIHHALDKRGWNHNEITSQRDLKEVIRRFKTQF